MTVFDRIYRTNAWEGRESRSGPGSGWAATHVVAGEIIALVAELGIMSVLNAGCGDDLWTPDLPGYLGVDVAPEALRLAKKNHPDRTYFVGDVRWVYGGFDLVLFRDAMQHLPLADGVAALDHIKGAGFRWLLVSTFVGGDNIDIAEGDAYSPDLTAEPFSLGQPERLIFDGYGYQDAAAIRDPRKHLGLWRLGS